MNYYYNDQTGQSQWEPPAASAQQEYTAQVCWRVIPTTGVYTEYALHNGDAQVLGLYDMAGQPYGQVAESQCLVQVAADGTATLASLGKRPTSLRARDGAPWFGLRRDAEPHVLIDGQQISLDDKNPGGAVFTCHVERVSLGSF